MIEPRKDAYGAEADTSHLVDYLELLALSDQPLTRAELADYLKDTGWVVRRRELYHTPREVDDEPSEDDEEGGADISPAEEQAANVFALAEARAAELGDLYPFDVDEVTVRRRDHLEGRHQAYLAFLALTVAHHYEVQLAERPENLFERAVADTMQARGLLTCDFGAVTRTIHDFRDALRAAAHEVGTGAAPEAAVSREHANDEGVDTISQLTWGDLRAGHWIYVGQATIGRSNTWQVKIQQPWTHHWRAWLTTIAEPRAYLAVPHHVEDSQLQYLTSGTTRIVLDRLRLSRYLPEVSDQLASAVNTVIDEGAYDPRQ